MMDALGQVEGAFLLWVQEVLRNGITDPILSFYTKLGDHGLIWISLCIGLLVTPKTRRAGLTGALALIFSLLFTNVLIKNLVARTRPWLILEGLIPLVTERDPNSFPSGHTSAAFAAATAFFHTLPRRWAGVTAVVMAAVMGLSRLYVGVHFPSDVLCGALVGFLCGELAWYISQRLQEHRERVYR